MGKEGSCGEGEKSLGVEAYPLSLQDKWKAVQSCFQLAPLGLNNLITDQAVSCLLDPTAFP